MSHVKYVVKIDKSNSQDGGAISHKEHIGSYFIKDDRIKSGVVLSGKEDNDTIKIKDVLKSSPEKGGFDARYTGKKSWWIANKHVAGLKAYLRKISRPDLKKTKKTKKTSDDIFYKIVKTVNLKDLTTLREKEIDYLLHQIKHKVRKNASLESKTKAVLDTLAKKLCHCVGDNKDDRRKIAICINSIFKNRGLKINKFSCKDKPTLLPKKGSKTVLQRQSGTSNIIKMN